MANPYYVDPLGGQAQSIVQGLSGLGSVLKEKRAEESAQNRMDQAQEAASVAFDSNDPRQVMKASIMFPEMQQQMSQAFGFLEKEGKQPTKQAVIAAYRNALADPVNAQSHIQKGIEQVSGMGGNPVMMAQDLEFLGENPNEALQAMEMAFAGIAPKEYDAYKKGGSTMDPKFLEEERKYAKEAVFSLKKRASSLTSTHGKVMSLIDQMREGKSRAASAVTMQLIARLASPGIVTEQEAANVAGVASTPVELMNYFIKQGDEESAERVRQSIDPLNPELINIDGLDTMANSLIASEAPSILQELDEAKGRARSAKISDRAFETNFGNLKSIEGLSKFIPQEPVKTPAPQGALDALLADPALADQFKAKYGYLP